MSLPAFTIPLRRGRPAVAMIELIFAIVVMGIALMSAPMLLSTSVKSSYVAIQQESINEAATHINNVLSYAWDENDTSDDYIAPILRAANGDVELGEVGTTGRRAGTPMASQRSFIRLGQRFVASVLGPDANDVANDDQDDFTNSAISLENVENTPHKKDYIDQNIRINTTVRYMNDSATYNGANAMTYNPGVNSNFTNIKRIVVTLSSNAPAAELAKTITLTAFSCNIGATDVATKGF